MSYNNFSHSHLKQNNVNAGQGGNAQGDGIHNANYFNQLSDLMQNISDKGATIAQTADGTVFVAETRIVVYKFVWDENKGVFVKQRTRNTRNNSRNQKVSESSILEMEDAEV